MGCQVIGAGWCRTGTSSLKVALDELGFGPCFHSRFIPYLPELRNACYAYSRGQIGTFPTERVFNRYKAAVDLPAALIPLLLDAYPDAKVLFSAGVNKLFGPWHTYISPCASSALPRSLMLALAHAGHPDCPRV